MKKCILKVDEVVDAIECARSRPVLSPLPVSGSEEFFFGTFEGAADENNMLTRATDEVDEASPSGATAVAAVAAGAAVAGAAAAAAGACVSAFSFSFSFSFNFSLSLLRCDEAFGAVGEAVCADEVDEPVDEMDAPADAALDEIVAPLEVTAAGDADGVDEVDVMKGVREDEFARLVGGVDAFDAVRVDGTKDAELARLALGEDETDEP